MGIKPALGWLALLLFTTTAQAEGTRDFLKITQKTTKMPAATMTMTSVPVTPKTKAPPASAKPVAPSPQTTSLVMIESSGKPRTDYEADVHAGVPLDGSIAKERSLDKGLVVMVFERQRRAGFRVGRDRIKRVVRFAPTTPSSPPHMRDHIDVLDTDDGTIVVATTVHSLFTTSDVYTFPRNAAALEQRMGVLEAKPSNDRIREALSAAAFHP